MASNSKSLIIHITYIYLSLRGLRLLSLLFGYEKMRATQLCRKQICSGGGAFLVGLSSALEIFSCIIIICYIDVCYAIIFTAIVS